MKLFLSGIPFALALAMGCGSRTELSAGGAPASDAGAGPAPVVQCGPAPATPSPLVVLDPASLPFALTVSGSYVYFGEELQAATHLTPVGLVSRVSTRGGARESVATSGYISGPLAADGSLLYFARGVASPNGPGSVAFSYPDVLAVSVAGGNGQDLPDPPGDNEVLDIATNGAPGVFFLSDAVSVVGPMAIAWWDPAAAATTTILSRTTIVNFFVDADHVYFLWIDGQDEVISSAPLTTGSATELARFSGAAGPGPFVALLGLDANHILFMPDARGGTIARMDKSGANVTTIVTGPPLGPNAFYVDDAWVYWTEQDRQERLARAPIVGGPEEVISDVATEYVQGIATDACNIYWLVVNPPALYWRAK